MTSSLHRPLGFLRGASVPLPEVHPGGIGVVTQRVEMRDGVGLATDVYLPGAVPAPVVVLRTPYGRRGPEAFLRDLARRGYVAVSQDCRGTGDSEPDQWQFMVFEVEDGYDCVEWITRQEWYCGFIGSFGGSYQGSTQYGMSTHPSLSAIVPEVAGLGVTTNRTPPRHMLINAYIRSIGKGGDVQTEPGEAQVASLDVIEHAMLEETLATGYFNRAPFEPLSAAIVAKHPELVGLDPVEAQDRMWEIFVSLPPAERGRMAADVLGDSAVTYTTAVQFRAAFGRVGNRSLFSIPRVTVADAVRAIRARALIVSGWYDWNIVDVIGTFQAIREHADSELARDCRMVISPSAHGSTGYREGAAEHPELNTVYGGDVLADLIDGWYRAVRARDLNDWPAVTYYLMGANEWRTADSWPPAGGRAMTMHLHEAGRLDIEFPAPSEPDSYVYDPVNATPTVGGAILSFVYRAGSADVSEVQARPDVLVYTSDVLAEDMDVVGPLSATIFASTTAVDTDFTVRVSDVFPDGRAVQIVNATLQGRYRRQDAAPRLITPGAIEEYLVELGSTANRFAAGHRLRVDISSADFPSYERNANLGGVPGEPIAATQTIFHDPQHPSRLDFRVLPARG